jgi:hypothetical protein
MCAEPIAAEHGHLVDLTNRGLMCTCRGCYLLFTPEGAGAGRYRPVPERYRRDPDFRLSLGGWDELQIPVGLVFVFYNTDQERYVAFYPSPAGATESLLPLEAWQRIMRENPGTADLAPDVEAILLRKVEDRFDGYLVPIDACYDLVGRVRLRWRGFDGGAELWTAIDEFFARLAERSEPLRPAGS